MTDTFARMRQIVGTTAEWAANDIVLADGEIGAERFSPTDHRMKVGDGVRTFSQLPYSSGGVASLNYWVSLAKTYSDNSGLDAGKAKIEADLAEAARLLAQAAATQSLTSAASSQTSSSDAAKSALLASNSATASSVLAGVSATFATKALMDAGAGPIANAAYAMVLNDETRGGLSTIYQKAAAVMTYVRTVPPSYSVTFANRLDPQWFVGLPPIVITDERNGQVACYSDGVVWRRVTDGRPAQSTIVNYYIDSVAGVDTNSGTTSAAAIKTIARLTAIINTLPAHKRAGLHYSFKYGSEFREEFVITSAMAGARCSAYGVPSDGKPKFIASDILPNSSFTLSPGMTNVYEFAMSGVGIDANADERPGIWVGGQRLTYASSISACNAKAGTYHHGIVTNLAAFTLYVHPYGSTNPTTDGKTYEATKRRSGIWGYAADGCEFESIFSSRNHCSYGSLCLGRNSVARNCEQWDGNTHNIFYRAGCNLYDNLAVNAYAWGEVPTIYIGFESNIPVGAKVRLERCSAEQRENNRLPTTSVTGITQSNPAVVTAVAHGLATNDLVVLSGVQGLTSVNGYIFQITVITPDTFSLRTIDLQNGAATNFNSTLLPAYTSGGTVSCAPPASAVGFYVHGSGAFESVEYIDCNAFGLDLAFSGSDTSSSTILRPIIKQCKVGWKFIGRVCVTGNGRRDFVNSPAIPGSILCIANSAGSEMFIDNVEAIINSTGNIQSSFANTRVELTNCRIIGSNTFIVGSGANQKWVLRGNEFVALTRGFVVYNLSSTGSSVLSDFNSFSIADGVSDFVLNGTTYHNLTDWRLATGNDANSEFGTYLQTERLQLTTSVALTISSGVLNGALGSVHAVDTEASAASDDLDTITSTTARDGQILVIFSANNTRTVVAKNATGNLLLNSDFVMDNVSDRLVLMYSAIASIWVELCRSNNGV